MSDAFRDLFHTNTASTRQTNYGIQSELEKNNALYDRYLSDIGGFGWDPSRMGSSYYRTDYQGNRHGEGVQGPGAYNTGDEGDPQAHGGNRGGSGGIGGGGGAVPRGSGGGGGIGGGGSRPPSRLDQARQRADQSYADIYGRYTDMFNRGFGMDPTAQGAFQSMATGENITPEMRDRIRGGGVFDEFSRTGGLSEGDRANIRSRGTSTIAPMFDAVRRNMERQGTITGAASPGYTGQLEAVTRDQSRGMADAALNTELGITDQVNQGRRWGAQGMSSAEQAYTDALIRSMLGGATGLQSGLETGRAQEQSALTGMRGLRTDVPGELALYEKLMQELLAQRTQSQQGILGLQAGYNPNIPFGKRHEQGISNTSNVMGMVGAGMGMGG